MQQLRHYGAQGFSLSQKAATSSTASGNSNWRSGGGNGKSTRQVRDLETSDPDRETSSEVDCFSLYTISRVKTETSATTFTVQVLINELPLSMDVDTCAEVSVASSAVYEQLGRPKLGPAPRLRAYGGADIPTLGQCDVEVRFRGQRKRLPLVFVKSPREKGLFGRPWIKQFEILNVNSVSPDPRLSSLLDEFADVFGTSTGCIRGHKAHLYFKEGAQFRMNRSRPVPYAFRPAVESELERLQLQGIITPVDVAEYTTTPLVVVPKQNGAVRICGDFKVSVNPHLNVQNYPMPTCDEVFQKLRGGQHFTKLDLADAYLQLELDEESRRYTVFTTHKGLFRVNRLAFGLACAPAIFQSVIEQVLAAIPHTQPYLDDIVVTGATTEEHLDNLRKCLARIRAAGIRLRREKCRFFEEQIEHLGHIVDKSGVRVNPTKTEAIRAAPPPKDLQALESWLGTAQYYADFIPGFATLAGPLNELRRHEVQWVWTAERQTSFDSIKSALAENVLRSHFDESKPVIVTTDASPYGVGAVLLQEHSDGKEHMITCASRTLSTAERNYSQLEKEALGIVFGFKRFNRYLAGREVRLFTDHKPLTFIFRPDAGVPTTALQRIQRWAMFLANFNYTVHHRPGKFNFQADALSRSPKPEVQELDVEVSAIQQEHISRGPADAVQVRQATRRDPVLSRVVDFVLAGWPTHSPGDEFQPWWSRREELTVESGVLLWGSRVVVPTPLRQQVLELLHESHPGSTRCKQLARSYVWWPGLDADIEREVSNCTSCAENRREPNAPALGQWEYASVPWQRVHVDHAGPFMGHYWLLWVDSYSKFAGVQRVKHPDSATTIKCLRETFSLFGLPNQLVSDNGPAFVGEEFQEFLHRNGVQHNRSAPCHPQTNGEAERFVQTFKRSMKASVKQGTEAELDRCLQQFLLKYRVTPHGTTGRTPAELFLGRRPTTLLDRLRPDLKRDVERREQVQHRRRLETGKPPDFKIGDRVHCRFWYGMRRWRKGVIVAIAGPLSYDVQVDDDLHRRHASQLLHDRGVAGPEDEEERELLPDELHQPTRPLAQSTKVSAPPDPIPEVPQPRVPPPQVPPPRVSPPQGPVVQPPLSTAEQPKSAAAPPKQEKAAPPPAVPRAPPPLRQPSTRVTRPPTRFDDQFSGLGSQKPK